MVIPDAPKWGGATWFSATAMIGCLGIGLVSLFVTEPRVQAHYRKRVHDGLSQLGLQSLMSAHLDSPMLPDVPEPRKVKSLEIQLRRLMELSPNDRGIRLLSARLNDCVARNVARGVQIARTQDNREESNAQMEVALRARTRAASTIRALNLDRTLESQVAHLWSVKNHLDTRGTDLEWVHRIELELKEGWEDIPAECRDDARTLRAQTELILLSAEKDPSKEQMTEAYRSIANSLGSIEQPSPLQRSLLAEAYVVVDPKLGVSIAQGIVAEYFGEIDRSRLSVDTYVAVANGLLLQRAYSETWAELETRLALLDAEEQGVLRARVADCCCRLLQAAQVGLIAPIELGARAGLIRLVGLLAPRHEYLHRGLARFANRQLDTAQDQAILACGSLTGSVAELVQLLALFRDRSPTLDEELGRWLERDKIAEVLLIETLKRFELSQDADLEPTEFLWGCLERWGGNTSNQRMAKLEFLIANRHISGTSGILQKILPQLPMNDRSKRLLDQIRDDFQHEFLNP